jgi:hypothetical protein
VVLVTIVGKENEVAFLSDPIHGNAWRVDFFVVLHLGSSYRDVVVGFAIPVAQRELVPFSRQARCETESIHL